MNRTKPKWWAWCLCGLSILLLVLFIGIVQLPLDQYAKALLAREIRENVKQQRFADARMASPGLFDLSVSEKIFEKIDRKHKLLWVPENSVLKFLDALDALQQNNPAILQSKLDTGFLRTVEEVSDLENPESESPLVRQVEELKSSMLALDFLNEQILAIKSSRLRIAPEFIAVRDSLRIFLGFQDETKGANRRRENESQKFEFYEEGILEGLPRLQELPRTFQDMKELRDALDALGVKVQVSNQSNPMEYFAETLNELRKRCLKTKESLTKLNESEQKLQERKKGLDHKSKLMRKKLIGLLKARLFVLLSPPNLFERLNILKIHNMSN
ncbi:MAG: hypothetical protein GYA55_00175 [SAR324 cluster bacterium]|uniref:Uncharacterized protein n=1 Tax=SAR324 cluster bacterium TaxID=2024889 RepID=A0A7X9IK35_9DELT|nr:hypothetical protein [SAR324 cluster bacterium]